MSAKIGTLLKWFFKHARLNYLHTYSKSSISSDPVAKIRHTDAQGHASERAHSGPTVLAESDSAGPLQDKHLQGKIRNNICRMHVGDLLE